MATPWPYRDRFPRTASWAGPLGVIPICRRSRVLRRRRSGAEIGGRRVKEFAAISALPGFSQNLLSTERTPFCRLLKNRRWRGDLSLRLTSPHGFQFRIGVDNALVGTCRSVDRVPTIGADLGVFADATRALWAFRASGESQRKPDGAEQNPKAEPQTAVCASVAGNHGGTYAEQEPEGYEKFHKVVFITLCGPIVRVPEASRGGSFSRKPGRPEPSHAVSQ